MPCAVGLDLDGVLANYQAAFVALLATQTGTARPTIGAYTRAERDVAYRTVEASETFWRELDAYPDTADALARVPDRTVFLTRRYGTGVRAQTADWLAAHGYPGHPAVVIVPSDRAKGEIATLVGLDALIDDSGEVGLAFRGDRFFLVDRPWNQHDTLRRNGTRTTLTAAVEALDHA